VISTFTQEGSMSVSSDIIPAPPLVRDKLAQNIREGRLLRALLRLSVRAAEERHRQPAAQSGALELRREATAR
jgi:hypothetical protein